MSVNAERHFSTSWTSGRPQGLMVRSTLDGREYQTLADDMTRQKMALVYLNTYVHQNEVQYSAVFVGAGAFFGLMGGNVFPDLQTAFQVFCP